MASSFHTPNNVHKSLDGSFDQGNQTDGKWVVYKRYSNFSSLNEQLIPYFKAMGLELPALPPKIEDKKDANMNQSLTVRKTHLQQYLTALILQLNDRMPAELCIFLGLHEQTNLGFNSFELVHSASHMNLKEGDPRVSIEENTMKVQGDVTKNFYSISVEFTKFKQLKGATE